VEMPALSEYEKHQKAIINGNKTGLAVNG